MGMGVKHLRCEYLENPLGIDVLKPRLSWQLISDQRGAVQSAYQIQVFSEKGLLWDTGKILSGQSNQIPYAGPDLRSGQRCDWKVRAWDEQGQPSDWSDQAAWEMGLLDPAQWSADWIEPRWEEDPKAFKPCPYFRLPFSINKPVLSARLAITCHGLYEASINGQPVGDQVFAPGYTTYPVRLQYQVYDVSSQVQAGENVIGAILGDGWYRGKIYIMDARNVYGPCLGLLAQLNILYTDGSEELITTHKDWKVKTGPILKSDMKDGEVYDARLEMPGWNAPGFNDSGWQPVRVAHFSKDNLVASMGVPVRKKEHFTPVAVMKTPNGETVVDMGQNFAGVVRLKVKGPQGTVVKLRHGEALDKEGNFTLANLNLNPNSANGLRQEIEYTLKGDGEEIYEPHFTVHGFRYVKVDGYPGELTHDALTGIAIYSDMPPTGSFSCSDVQINQLHHNIQWSQKSNFLDLPTDCPTRERAGWTGDAQIFVRTGSYLMNTAAFFTKWLKDLKAGQYADGMVSNFSPNPFGPDKKSAGGGLLTALEGSSGWGDAAVIIPWTIYLTFGDKQILAEQYESMKAWVEYERKCASKMNWVKYLNPRIVFNAERRQRQKFIWDTSYQWGEWLEPGDSTPIKMGIGVLQRVLFGEPLVATAYFAYSSSLLAETAQILGKNEDARIYQELAEQVKQAYMAEFLDRDGHINPDKQASYVRVLQFGLLPDQLRPAVVDHLVRLVNQAGVHIGTGFLSTPFLCSVLGENGHLDLAYALLNQKTIPSWLYSVTKGATTIWESWEGIKEDGTPNASLNHYSYGAVGGWLQRVVAGLEIGEPGYKRILIQPHPGGGLTQASATYQSIYGEIESGWELLDHEFKLNVKIPPNTSARVVIPKTGPITESGQPVNQQPGIANVSSENGATLIEVGAGSYRFSCPA